MLKDKLFYYNLKKRSITLIEIMIVMFLIALITSVIAYNYRGSLDEGKVFKTKVGIQKIQTILNLQAAKNPDFTSQIQERWIAIVKASPIANDPSALIKDGWGEEYNVYVDDEGVIQVESKKLEEYNNNKNNE